MIALRVGEKNNFNHTDKEYDALKKYSDKYHIFTNSNSFVKIKSIYPSIVTLNPYMVFNPLPKGSETSQIKAFRIKVYIGQSDLNSCLKYAKKLNIPVLLTIMRFKSTKSILKHVGLNFDQYYTYSQNWYRLKLSEQKKLIKSIKAKYDKVYICDESGKGCIDCYNCTKLCFGEIMEIRVLNLSVSGIKDKNGKQGLCPFDCPDCWAKFVTFGKSPQTDKIIKNRKLTGELTIIKK